MTLNTNIIIVLQEIELHLGIILALNYCTFDGPLGGLVIHNC